MDGTKKVDGLGGADGVKLGCGGACSGMKRIPLRSISGLPKLNLATGRPEPKETTLADAERQAFQSGHWMVAVFWVEKGRVNGFARQSYFPMDDYPNAVDQFCTKLIPGLIGNAGHTTAGVGDQSPEAAPNSNGPAIQVMEETIDDGNAGGNAPMGTDPDVMAGQPERACPGDRQGRRPEFDAPSPGQE